MCKLEDLQPNAAVRGILPDALDLTYKDPAGRVANQLLYRHDEPRIEPLPHLSK